MITVEDPVEYRLAGLNQVQINPRAGLTFATALRSILRSDPDVVMVGEIRDVETAKISIEAALTGHFVLSTLHTNDAPSALTRLQRDGRRAVPDRSRGHRRARPAPCAPALRALQGALHARPRRSSRRRASPTSSGDGKAELFRRNGCVRCRQTGYRGRVGVFELLSMDEELSTLAARKASHEELERAAMEGGMNDALGRRHREGPRGLTSSKSSPASPRLSGARRRRRIMRRVPKTRPSSGLGRGAGAPPGAFLADRAAPSDGSSRSPAPSAASRPGSDVGRAAARSPCRRARPGRRPVGAVGAPHAGQGVDDARNAPSPPRERASALVRRAARGPALGRAGSAGLARSLGHAAPGARRG